MGRDYHYEPGNFYRTDDRTGFPTRANRTKRQWNGIQVDERVWEPRQPQDLVRGVPDRQDVPQARPKPPAVYTGPQSEETSADAVIGQNVIPLVTTLGLTPGHKVGVMLATGQYFWTWLLTFIAGAAVLYSPLPAFVPSGNLITDFGPSDDALTSGFLLQEDGALIATSEGGYLGVAG